MAEGYSIFDKLPKSTLGIAETILSPAAAALSPMSITNTQTEPTGIGKKLPEGVVEDFPKATPLSTIGESGRYLSPEPALTMDPSKVEIDYSDPFLGAQAITKRRRIIENPELLTPIISVKDSDLVDEDLMSADYVTTKRLTESGNPETFAFSAFLEGEDTLEARQKLVDEIQGTKLGYYVDDDARQEVDIRYMTAVYDEKYEKVLENIDKKLVGIPFINDEARSRYMLNMGYDEDTNRAIFAKQFDNFLINQGVKSQRTRAGIILHSVNLPQFGGVGFGDPSKLVGITNETLKYVVAAGPYLVGEAFGAVSEGLKVGDYNLSDSTDREKWLSTFIPSMPALIQDRYTQLNLDVPYHVAEAISRRFSGYGTQAAATAIEVAGPTKLATLRKVQAGKKEMQYFGDFEARYRKKFRDAEPEDVLQAFQAMRKKTVNVGIGKYSFPVDLTKAKDIKLIGGIANIPAKAIAVVNGLRTSSRFKNGMELTDAAQIASNRIEVRNMSQYYRNLHNQKNGIINRAKQAGRDLNPDEARRLDEVARKIEITKADLRKTVVRSETPKFIRESNVQDAYVIVGAATANQAFEIYGGDPMMGEFIGALGGIAYGLVKGGKDAKKLLKKFDLDNVTDKQLNIAELVLSNMKNFDPEFQEALKTRVKYFNGLKQELVAAGVNPEVLDRSVSRILGLSLLQTLEEGSALDLHGPQVAAFNAQTQTLHTNLLTQQKFVSELRTVMQNLARTEGVDIEGNAIKKLYDTVEAAVTYADGTTAQLADDLEVIGRSYETSVKGMILGSDDIYDHLDEASTTELSSALDSLTKHNISRIDQSSVVAIRDEVVRTQDGIAGAIKDKATQIARILPTQGDVNKQVNKILPDGTIIRPGREPAKARDIQTSGDALAALLESRNVREREIAAAPFRQLDNAQFRTADDQVIIGKATTDAGPVLDSMFDVLGTAEGTTLLLEMSGKTMSRSTSGKMFAFLDEAAGAFILDVAQRQGKNADEIVEDALTAARQANDPATIKLLNDKRIPQDLLVAQLLRKDLQLDGEDIGVLPISFQQAKEMSDALNQISFKTQDSTAKMKIDNVQNIADGLMDSFEVQLETGQRVSVGQLFIKQEDGSLRSTQEVLAEGKSRWTEYKRRFYNDENVSNWLGWKNKDARLPTGVSSDYPLGIDYGKNAPVGWLDFNKIADMKDVDKTKFTRSLSETIGDLDANGNYRIQLNSENGQATRAILEARSREWLTETVTSGKPIDFNDLRRKMNSLQDTFIGVTDKGTEVRLLDLDRVMTDVFPDFGKNSVDPEYFEAGMKKLQNASKGEKARVVREAKKIQQGISESKQFLRQYSQGVLDSGSVGSVLISGGVGRLNDLKKHLKSLKRSEEETNEIIKSLLVQEIDRKAFNPTGRYTIDPSDQNLMVPNVDLDIESLKQFMGFNDPSTAEVVREVLGDKAYDTYRSIISFTANEAAESAGRTNISGIPRKFSVESYISRFYAVNRGVVSFRYVGTEAVLQQMRQKNMSLLTAALTDPKVGSLLMEMVDTGKPLPMDKDRQLLELLVIATERYDNWRETAKDPIKVTSDFGHEFVYNPTMNYFGLSP
jgi:DNA-binding phage protein